MARIPGPFTGLEDPSPVSGGTTRLYCCKKWVAGELRKFYSRKPCPSGAVQCSDPDPSQPDDGGDGGDGGGGGIRDPQCLQSCRDARRQAMRDLRGVRGGELSEARKRVEREFQLCLKDCSTGNGGDGDGIIDDDDEVGGVAPCSGGFLLPKKAGVRCRQGYTDRIIGADHWCCPKEDDDEDEDDDDGVGGVGPCDGSGHELPFGSSRCEEGFSIKKAADGKFWCCDDSQVIGGNPCSGGGGYELTSEVGFAGGAGQGKAPWGEVPGTERSSEWEGHMVWNPSKGAFVNTLDPEGQTFDTVCRKNFVRQQDNEGKTWCCPGAGDGDGDGDGDGGFGGEFQWGEGLQGLLARIQERANQLLDYPRGLTPQERQGVINYAIESVKSGERGRLQSSQDLLARRGLLGSGFEFEEAGRIQRETRGRETEIRREFGIDELDRRFSELMGTTGMVQGLTGTLMQGEQIPEILSGARRSEGQASINSLLALLGGSMGGQGNQYWNAILTQLMGNQGGGGGMMDWLPWLLASQTARTPGGFRTGGQL